MASTDATALRCPLAFDAVFHVYECSRLALFTARPHLYLPILPYFPEEKSCRTFGEVEGLRSLAISSTPSLHKYMVRPPCASQKRTDAKPALCASRDVFVERLRCSTNETNIEPCPNLGKHAQERQWSARLRQYRCTRFVQVC